MTTKGICVGGILIAFSAAMLHAESSPKTLQGKCAVSEAEETDRASWKLDRGGCQDRDCHQQHTDEPWSVVTGLTRERLGHEGALADATIRAEAGRLTCSGTVRDQRLVGEYTFVPDAGFVARMGDQGFHGLDSEKLEAYTLFQVQMDWIESLRRAGIKGMDTDNLIALRIFKADATYVHSLVELGYPSPDASKLIALKVQGVDPAEVKQVRALGLQPDLDELIQMRIFNVTPDFIKRMQTRGFNGLTISKLVQIRIFNLAD